MSATRPSPTIEVYGLVRRLRWVMLAVILIDITATLTGQPSTYWSDPRTVEEGNRLFHWIMSQGYHVSLFVDLFYVGGSFLLVTYLPWRLGLSLLFALILGHFFGGSSWLCYRFQLGAMGMILYGVLLAITLVAVGFPVAAKRPHP